MVSADDTGPLPTFSEVADDGDAGRGFADLVAQALDADIDGWGFGWLDGRATEERPPWGYARLLADRLATAASALDLDTGGGEVLAQAPSLPAMTAATEAWPPNLARARTLLGPRGVQVVAPTSDGRLPFADASFGLVTARHPVQPAWAEVARVLADGGTYFAQHVGPGSAFELIEWFTGPLPDEVWNRRDAHAEAADADAAGLDLVDLRAARLRMEFFDIGAVVWLLRKCPWWVPDFTVDRYADRLLALDATIRANGSFVAHSTRHLIELRRRPRQ